MDGLLESSFQPQVHVVHLLHGHCCSLRPRHPDPLGHASEGLGIHRDLGEGSGITDLARQLLQDREYCKYKRGNFQAGDVSALRKSRCRSQGSGDLGGDHERAKVLAPGRHHRHLHRPMDGFGMGLFCLNNGALTSFTEQYADSF